MADMNAERSSTGMWPWALLGLFVSGIVIWVVALALGADAGDVWPWALLGLFVSGVVIWAVAQASGRQ